MTPPLFPLARLADETAARSPLSRGVRQRVNRRRRIECRMNDAIDSLNRLVGSGGSLAEPSRAVHEEVLTRLVELAKERASDSSTPSPQESAVALLRGRLGYEGGAANVASYEPSKVSLPSDVCGTPFADQVGA